MGSHRPFSSASNGICTGNFGSPGAIGSEQARGHLCRGTGRRSMRRPHFRPVCGRNLSNDHMDLRRI